MSNFDERLLQLIAEERFCGKSPLFDNTSDLRLFQLTDCEDTARMPFKDIAIKVYCMAIDDFANAIKSNSELGYIGYIDRVIDEIAKQLKAGGKE